MGCQAQLHTLFIRWRFSLAPPLTDEVSKLAQTLLSTAPTLVLIFPGATQDKSRQSFPRYPTKSKPRFKLWHLEVKASHTLTGLLRFSRSMFHSSDLPTLTRLQCITPKRKHNQGLLLR
jgi:hypothetical protein